MALDNIMSGIITMFLGLPGDVFSRFMWKNCSVDKLWLSMLCPIPPLSIVPAVYYFMDKIEKGTDSCSSSLDIYLMILPVAVLLMNFLFTHIAGPSWAYWMFIISCLILFGLFRYIKNSQMCDISDYPDTTPGKQILSAFLHALAVICAIIMIDFIVPYAEYIPIIGYPFRLWDKGNDIMITKPLFLTAIYFISNLYANLPDVRKHICSPKI